MLLNKLLVIGMLLMSVGNVVAWGENTPYASTEAWITDTSYCSPSFTVMVANFNNSYPNAFNYTLTYTLKYRDTNGDIQDESMNVETYNITIGSGQYTWLSHNINVNTVMNILTEVEEDTTNPYRTVKIELDYSYCDNGGCNQNSGLDHIVDFTNCDPVEGTSYGDPLQGVAGGDYGFSLDGRGTGGGSGSIYEGLDVYGSSGGDTTGMGEGFNMIFWCIIPLIFILAVMKLSSRVMK